MMVLSDIDQYKYVSRNDSDGLLTDKISNVLSDEQKANEIRNLLYDMSKKDESM